MTETTKDLFKKIGYVPIIIRLKRSYEVIVGKERFELEEIVSNHSLKFTKEKAHQSLDRIAVELSDKIEDRLVKLSESLESDSYDIAVKVAEILAPLIDYARDNLPKDEIVKKLPAEQGAFAKALEKELELYKAAITKQLNTESPLFSGLIGLKTFSDEQVPLKYHYGIAPIVTPTDVPKDQVGIIAGIPYEPNVTLYVTNPEDIQTEKAAIGHRHGNFWFPNPLCDSNCSIHSDKGVHSKAIKITGITNT